MNTRIILVVRHWYLSYKKYLAERYHAPQKESWAACTHDRAGRGDILTWSVWNLPLPSKCDKELLQAINVRQS